MIDEHDVNPREAAGYAAWLAWENEMGAWWGRRPLTEDEAQEDWGNTSTASQEGWRRAAEAGHAVLSGVAPRRRSPLRRMQDDAKAILMRGMGGPGVG